MKPWGYPRRSWTLKKHIKVEEKEKKGYSYPRLLRYKSQYIKGLLKDKGTYTPELSGMISIAAAALAHLTLLGREFSKPDYSPVVVEKSREGYDRYSKNPNEELNLRYLEEARRCMAALGLSMDSKKWDGGDEGGAILLGYNREE